MVLAYSHGSKNTDAGVRPQNIYIISWERSKTEITQTN